MKVPSPSFFNDTAESISLISQRRFEDIHWIAMGIFVSDMPATQAVPEPLRDIFHPIDLVESKTALDDGPRIDRRVRTHPATDDEIKAEIEAVKKHLLPDAVLTLSEERLALVRGIAREELRLIIALSVVDGYEKKRNKSTSSPEDYMLDPGVIDAYRNRWARVA